jgi:hypothetical protein
MVAAARIQVLASLCLYVNSGEKTQEIEAGYILVSYQFNINKNSVA